MFGVKEQVEGCGQWISTKSKRNFRQPLQKQHKKNTKKTFNTVFKRDHIPGVYISASPIPEHVKKRLARAKQCKLERFLKPFKVDQDFIEQDRGAIEEEMCKFGNAFKTRRVLGARRRQRWSGEGLESDNYMSGSYTKSIDVSGVMPLQQTMSPSEDCLHDCVDESSDKHPDCQRNNVPNRTRKLSDTENYAPNAKKIKCSSTGGINENYYDLDGCYSDKIRNPGNHDSLPTAVKFKETSCVDLDSSNDCIETGNHDKNHSSSNNDSEYAPIDLNNYASDGSMSESFHYTQWVRAQVNQCKHIQHKLNNDSENKNGTGRDDISTETSLIESPETKRSVIDGNNMGYIIDADGDHLRSFNAEADNVRSILGAEAFPASESEFEYSGWVWEQKSKCRKIQKGVQGMNNWSPLNLKDTTTHSLDSEGKDCEASFKSKKWTKEQRRKCKHLQHSSHQVDVLRTRGESEPHENLKQLKESGTGSGNNECPFYNSGHRMGVPGDNDDATFQDSESFRFSQWVQEQKLICKNLQTDPQ
ncbi:uncharacterized protein LOC116617508 [Nematostella vectensis]|uniref:uncharacterized protein LOC116617508 n=1 Tax=Nematostella vectensis TaxID=45351 RepID=UPI002076F1AE|nr:uncharacterized protein LOC116617508 [Nematostella vectensis]